MFSVFSLILFTQENTTNKMKTRVVNVVDVGDSQGECLIYTNDSSSKCMYSKVKSDFFLWHQFVS